MAGMLSSAIVTAIGCEGKQKAELRGGALPKNLDEMARWSAPLQYEAHGWPKVRLARRFGRFGRIALSRRNIFALLPGTTASVRQAQSESSLALTRAPTRCGTSTSWRMRAS